MFKDILLITPWILSMVFFAIVMTSIQILLYISYYMSQIYSKIIRFVNKYIFIYRKSTEV
jgi:hypothetical protein